MQEDRSVLDLLTADYTFVNERLAKHYGIPNIYGPQFRRVTLPPELDMRRGLLGKGALLTVTSNAARTSPVDARQVVPDDVPRRRAAAAAAGRGHEPQGESRPATPPATSRCRRCATSWSGITRNPACASCHKIFEPMGLALENFDAIGAWRTLDEGKPIDATGVMTDGTKVDGVVGLRGVHRAVSGSVRARRDREAADLRARPRRRRRRHADGARDRARRGGQRVPVLVDRARAS